MSLVSFALDFLVCMLIVELTGMNYLVAMVVSFTLGTIFNDFRLPKARLGATLTL